MDDTTIVVWIGAAGTLIAAGAAVAAAVYTKKAANEAARAAKAAADQVELQRPRPIVIAAFVYCFAENKGNMAANDRDLQLRNMGDSPAFDVDVSPIETPGLVPSLGAPSRLETERLPLLAPGSQLVPCVHRLEPPRALQNVMGKGAIFVDDAKTFFDQQAKHEGSRKADFRYEIPFTVSYSAMDGRRLEQRYLFVIFFPTLHAWVEIDGSLLGTSARGSA